MTKPQPTFPLNAWYAAAYDVELGRQLLARTLCEQKLVLYRKLDGQAVALEDACWHRLLPLSLGRLQDDQVVCGYHGLVFNALGQCTRMPSQASLGSWRVRSQRRSGRLCRRRPGATGSHPRPGWLARRRAGNQPCHHLDHRLGHMTMIIQCITTPASDSTARAARARSPPGN